MKINACHYFKRHFAQNSDFVFNQQFFNKNRLGSLPYDWIRSISHQNISGVTEKVDRTFQEYALKMADNTLSRDVFETENKNLRERLSRILSRDDVEVEFINKGFYKNCQKIKVGNYEYALLTFRDGVDNLEAHIYGHGVKIEPCLIFYMYKNYSRGRITRPFMTRFSSDINDRDAYILTKFINSADTKRSKKKALLSERNRRYKFEPWGEGNFINGICIDVGGTLKLDNAWPRDLVRLFSKMRLYETIHFRLDGIPLSDCGEKAIVERVNAAIKADNIICDLLNNGYDIYNRDNRDIINSLSPIERKVFLKKVRALKSFHKQKQELVKKGLYENYIETIRQKFHFKSEQKNPIMIEANRR